MRGGQYQSKKAKTYFVYGAPLCIGLLLSYALNAADVYLIAGIMGSASAGNIIMDCCACRCWNCPRF